MKSETNLASNGAEGFGGEQAAAVGGFVPALPAEETPAAGGGVEQAGFAGIHECGFSGIGDPVAEEGADGWEPLEILRGMDAQSTLRSVALTLKVADLYVV